VTVHRTIQRDFHGPARYSKQPRMAVIGRFED
jgi:hypothetical protein